MKVTIEISDGEKRASIDLTSKLFDGNMSTDDAADLLRPLLVDLLSPPDLIQSQIANFRDFEITPKRMPK